MARVVDVDAHLIPMTTGDEQDALTKGGKRLHSWKPGERADIKRQYVRRQRHLVKAALRAAMRGATGLPPDPP